MPELTRRDILGSAALVGGWMAVGPGLAFGRQKSPADAAQDAPVGGLYQLPPLPYGYGDLEPFVDAQTMRLHHDVHHAGYVKAANAAVTELGEIQRTGGDSINRVGAVTGNLAFALSGHILHSLFWESMTRGGGGDPPADSEIGKLIRRDFGSFEAFRANLAAAARQVQGSGWGVLAYEPTAQRLMVLQAKNHENAGVWGAVPLLAVDVWEHAYYLKYQNRRSDFIKAFLDVVDWESAENRLAQARKLG